MTSKAPLRISQWILVPLGIMMVFYATLPHTGIDRHPLYNPSHLFMSSRVPQTGEHFIDYRRRTAPMWVYNGLHSFPAIVWCVLMPMQHSARLRKWWPAFHRTTGYAILSISLLLSMTGYWFFLSKNAYTHKNPFHLHSLGPSIPFRWPTFELSTFLIAPFYWGTMYKAAATARAKDFASHRRWAVLHTFASSAILLQRLSISLMYVVGFALTFLPADAVHQFFQVAQNNDAMAEAELSVFALATILVVGFLIAWMAYEFRRAGYLGGAERSIKVAIVSGKKLDNKYKTL